MIVVCQPSKVGSVKARIEFRGVIRDDPSAVLRGQISRRTDSQRRSERQVLHLYTPEAGRITIFFDCVA